MFPVWSDWHSAVCGRSSPEPAVSQLYEPGTRDLLSVTFKLICNSRYHATASDCRSHTATELFQSYRGRDARHVPPVRQRLRPPQPRHPPGRLPQEARGRGQDRARAASPPGQHPQVDTRARNESSRSFHNHGEGSD